MGRFLLLSKAKFMLLSQLLNLNDLKQYKFHAARNNGQVEPLDAFVSSWKDWEKWNRYRGALNDFSRPYVLSFIRFYPERNTWLYGGTFKIIDRRVEPKEYSYDVELVRQNADLIGRLKVTTEKPLNRNRALNLEKIISKLHVSELLKTCYTGSVFPGFDNISLSFPYLETIIAKELPDWKAPLQDVKGVYLITDQSNSRKYIGAAYGEARVWSRWCDYTRTGHGNNKELIEAIGRKNIHYARAFFQITLLEHWPVKTLDEFILARVTFWKRALMTRGAFGYNAN